MIINDTPNHLVCIILRFIIVNLFRYFIYTFFMLHDKKMINSNGLVCLKDILLMHNRIHSSESVQIFYVIVRKLIYSNVSLSF